MLEGIKNKFINQLIKIIELKKEQSKKNLFKIFLDRPGINLPTDFSYKDLDIFKIINNEFGKITISSGVVFREDFKILATKSAEVYIDKNVFFNNNCSINSLEKITIGENTIFGEGVKIYDHNHKIIRTDQLHVDRDNFSISPVIIGKNCWIASNVVILKGVEIGDNCVIGAGCIIHKSVPANTIVKNNQNLVFESI